MMQLWYMKPRGRMAKRGAAKMIKQLKSVNAENELIVSFDQKNWKIRVNGVDVSNKFGSLAHNDSWKKVQRARGIANQPVRRFAITENMEIPQWKNINHDQCGYHYRLSGSTMSQLSSAMPDFVELLTNANEVDASADQCLRQHDPDVENIKAASRIVGGKTTVPGRFPWIVALRLENSLTPHQCGATLINKCWIVTAAHCFPGSPDYYKKYTARIGDFYNLRDEAEKWKIVESVHSSKLEKYIPHPKYDSNSYENDIALAKLVDCVPSFNTFRAPGTLLYITVFNNLNSLFANFN